MKKILLALIPIGTIIFLASVCRKDMSSSGSENIVITEQIDPYSKTDSFILSEIKRAIVHGRDEYFYKKDVIVIREYVKSAHEAVDFFNKEKIFTKISLSNSGDTIRFYPVAFKSSRQPEKTTYSFTLDLLVDFKVAEVDVGRRHKK